ncbi:MAG TPA: hypothetical protein VEA44_02285 [Caulobacter sp.]|nr:hypothetical protein [Caulobacter sp.]
MSKTRFFLAAGCAVALLTACGRSDREEAPPPADPSVAAAPEAAKTPQAPAVPLGPGQTLTAEGAVVSVGPAAAKLATPAYAPLYPGAIVASSAVGESGVGPGGMVIYRTDAPPGTVIAFYQDKVKAAGKPVTMNADIGGGVHMLTAGDSGEGKGAMQVIASPSGRGSQVELTWSDD